MALIIPGLNAHPFLQHRRDVGDVICVIMGKSQSSEGLPRSLTSGQDSKVKQSVIPLELGLDPSRE